MGKIPDISYWQGYVAFSQATKDETDYIIHRASCGTARDTRFPENVAKICALNLPYGVYHYVMALSTERARYEAEVFYNDVARPTRRIRRLGGGPMWRTRPSFGRTAKACR